MHICIFTLSISGICMDSVVPKNYKKMVEKIIVVQIFCIIFLLFLVYFTLLLAVVGWLVSQLKEKQRKFKKTNEKQKQNFISPGVKSKKMLTPAELSFIVTLGSRSSKCFVQFSQFFVVVVVVATFQLLWSNILCAFRLYTIFMKCSIRSICL